MLHRYQDARQIKCDLTNHGFIPKRMNLYDLHVAVDFPSCRKSTLKVGTQPLPDPNPSPGIVIFGNPHFFSFPHSAHATAPAARVCVPPASSRRFPLMLALCEGDVFRALISSRLSFVVRTTVSTQTSGSSIHEQASMRLAASHLIFSWFRSLLVSSFRSAHDR